MIEVRHTNSERGRGVFACRNILKDEVLEESPILLLSSKESLIIRKTILYHYFFEWGHQGATAIGLGNISMYNHSDKPNAKHIRIFEKECMMIVALENISVGEEICINYLNAYEKENKKERLWFSAL